MTALIRVLPIWSKIQPHTGRIIISTVAKGCPDLSPFCLGPCKLYGRFVSKNMENAWQFSKVYSEHMGKNGRPKKSWWQWAMQGWRDRKARRYPMGRGRKPVCSWWDGMQLDYIQARKTIYGPLYAEQVVKTETYRRLKHLMKTMDEIILLDYDAYDHREQSMSLKQVLNEPKLKMGHAFVLAMLLTDDPALTQMELR